MSDIFSSMRELELSAEDIQQAEVFAQQYLESKFPTIDFRQGTGVRDLVIRPNAVLLAMLKKYITVYFDNATLSSVTNDTPTEVVDRLLSNWFIERNKGSFAVVRARLYFLFPDNKPMNVQVPTSAYFSTDNTRMFYPDKNYFVQALKDGATPLTGNYYLNWDGAEELWFVDLDLSSGASDESFNDLTQGDLLYFSIFNPYFVKGKILYMSQAAVAEENNVDLVNRSYNAVSTRNLINDPSISSRLYDEFNYIKLIRVYGFGDPSMWRDYVQVIGVNTDAEDREPERYRIHIGGCVDIYTQTEFRTTVMQFITDKNGIVELTGPIFEIYRSPISGGEAPDDIPYEEGYSMSIPNSTSYTDAVPFDPQKDRGLSSEQVIRLEFGLNKPLKKVSMVVRKFLGLENMQSFVNNPQNRVVCADHLIRAFEPVLINIEATSYDKIDPEELAKVRPAIEEYFNRTEVGGTIYVSDIYKLIGAQGLDAIETPIKVSYVAIAKDLVKTAGDVVDSLGSTRTQRFILDQLTIEEKK